MRPENFSSSVATTGRPSPKSTSASACATFKTAGTSATISAWPKRTSGGHCEAAAPPRAPSTSRAAHSAREPPLSGSVSGNGSVGSGSASRAPSIASTSDSDRVYCAGNKFHRAAIDGYLDMLCEASKRDTNTHAPSDQLQLTPTLLAAQSGQLEALRILVGRGGDPERVSSFGSSALHLAAARNHLNCVSFLVNFGVNMWALDNELRTAKDLAALGPCKQVLDYLDQMMAKQSAINTKLVQKLKDRAKVAAEKRLKAMRKQQLKAIKQVERDERLLAKLSSNRRLLKAAHSMGDIKLVGRAELVGAGADSISFSPNEPLAPAPAPASGPLRAHKLASLLGQRFRCESGAGGSCVSSVRSAQRPPSDLDSSYCSSSVSSVSGGYLSSCSARSILKSALVARPRCGPFGPDGSGGTAAAAVTAAAARDSAGEKSHHEAQRPKYSDLVAVGPAPLASRDRAQETAPAAAGPRGEPTSRLRALGGGVSRKVHLKRLLFASDARAEPASQALAQGAKLCQVSPVSRLKMGGERPLEPPGPSLKRSRSEPDFGAAIPRDCEDDDDDDDDNDDNDDNDKGEEEEERESERRGALRAGKTSEDERRASGSADSERSGDQHPETASIPAPPPEPPTPPVGQRKQPAQHNLLTQCLSQLKFQQQQQQQKQQQQQQLQLQQQRQVAPGTPKTTAPVVAKPNGLRAATSNSDELIRHQLSASEFPLRPSIIKQQLHMRQQLQQQQLALHDRRRKSTTIMSVDSIGSAGSFAQRNTVDAPGPVPAGASNSSTSSGLSSSSFDIDDEEEEQEEQEQEQDNADEGARSKQVAGARAEPPDLMAHFLAANNLSELAEVLARERIDFEALLLLTEADLKSLDILLGPRRKLLNAISRHKAERRAARPPFTVVDTQF